MKNSFSLLEIIISILISSVVIVYSMFYIKEISIKNHKTQEEELRKINLLATKIFLQKNKKEIDKVQFYNNNLYFDSALLLDGVNSFEMSKNEDDLIIIKIKYSDLIEQQWKL